MKKAVFAIGNPLLGDDSIGPLVLQQLKGIDAELIDAGWGLDPALIRRYDKVAVIDAGFFSGKPGELGTFTLDQMKPRQMQSTHGIDIIFLLKKYKTLPEIKFFLIQPRDAQKLTDEVKNSIPKVAKAVKEWLD